MRDAIAAIAAVALIAGCAGGAPEDVVCGAYCDFFAECKNDLSDCQTNCVSHNPTFSRFSDDFAGAFSECLPEQSCSAIDAETLAACVEPKLEPTSRTRSFCAAHTLSLFECGYSMSTEECESTYSAWGDSVLVDIEGCDETSSCEEREVCMRAVLGNL